MLNATSFCVRSESATLDVMSSQTGDWVRLDQPKGKYLGSWTGRLLGIRATGVFDLKTPKGTAGVTYRNYTLIEHGDGYDYQSA